MGAVVENVRDFYSSVTEIVGLKSGILLDRLAIREILKETNNDEFLNEDNLEKIIRTRSEDYEYKIIDVRRRIGNLPDESPTLNDWQELRNSIPEIGMQIINSPLFVIQLLMEKHITEEELVKRVKQEYKCSDKLAKAITNIGLEKHDTSLIIPPKHEWKSTTKLSDLYESDIQSENETDYLDQKFLDYLAVNGTEIEKIHWRNFEKFCAEYFKKEGFHVVLGPGTNDGGVDIRIYNNKSYTEKPYMLIQCKRHSKKNKVSIETVKSFYTDVAHENADQGLIATTGYVAPGGKKVIDARRYNITLAENSKIKQWAKNMFTYKT